MRLGFVFKFYTRAYALYEVSVRQTRCLPPASFRFFDERSFLQILRRAKRQVDYHLTMDTLALGYAIPAIRARSGLTPVS